jgi:hypothetical protein
VSHTLRSAVPAVVDAPAPAPPAGRPTPRIYLRRYAVQPARRRHGGLMVILAALACLLFAKVWECTVANSLAMDRDRLRTEVRSLRNRIRLSSELRDQAALARGISSESLARQGFVDPDPSRIIDVDLNQPVARAVTRSGVVARLGAWIRSMGPSRPMAADAGVRQVPTGAEDGR